MPRQRHEHRRTRDDVERQAQQAATGPPHRGRLVDGCRVGLLEGEGLGHEVDQRPDPLTAWLTNATSSAIRTSASPHATTSVTISSTSKTR